MDLLNYPLSFAIKIFNSKAEKIISYGLFNKYGVDNKVYAKVLFKKSEKNCMLNFVISTKEDNVWYNKDISMCDNHIWIYCEYGKVFICESKFMCYARVYDKNNTCIDMIPFENLYKKFDISHSGSELIYNQFNKIINCLQVQDPQNNFFSMNDTLQIASIRDEIKKQIHLKFPCDTN